MDPSRPTRLPRSFYAGHTVEVARALLGKLLVRQQDGATICGRVVETEAYHGPEDLACHASRGLTPRTAPMFEEPGRAYVYQIYGMWFCLNAVTGPVGHPSAVLIRAVAPRAPDAFGPKDAAGPGKLCRLMNINLQLNRADLTDGDQLWLADDGHRVADEQICAGPRIGVEYAGAWAETPWRFWVAGDRSVSRARGPTKAPARARSSKIA